MLELISLGILEHLKASGLDVQDIDFKALVDRTTGSTMRPKVNVSIDSGIHKKVTMNTYKQIPTVSLFLLVQNLKGEKESKFAAYKLINAITYSLLMEKLNLPLQDAFLPVSFQNVTDENFAGAGFSLYQLDFTCSFNYTKELTDNVDGGELLRIVNTYWTETEERIGNVELSEVSGGVAFGDSVEEISGGIAGTEGFAETVYGGKSESTYE